MKSQADKKKVVVELTADNEVAGYYDMKVASASDYYPFGMGMPNRTHSSNKYRYGFNGKEKDESGEFGNLTSYDYGFRIYNPGVGRFLSVDPLSRSYPWNSVYAFAENDVIRNSDLDGAESLIDVVIWLGDKFNSKQEVKQVLDDAGVENQTLRKVANFYGGATSTIISDSDAIKKGAEQQFDKLKRYVNGDVTGVEVVADGVRILARKQVMLVEVGAAKIKQVETIAGGGEEAFFEGGALSAEVTLLAAGGRAATSGKIPKGPGAQGSKKVFSENRFSILDSGKKIVKALKLAWGKKITFQQKVPGTNTTKDVTVSIPKGFEKVKGTSHGQAVYSNGKKYISPDVDGHSASKGGVWKGAESIEYLGSKQTRSGTFDKDLKWVAE